MNEAIVKIEGMKSRLNKILKSLNLDQDKERLKDLETKTSDAGFWNNQSEAQSVMQEIADLTKQINKWQEFNNQLNELEQLSALIEESDIDEFLQSVEKLEKILENNEFDLLFSEEFDKNNAILSIHAGTGGTDAQDWSEMLLRMYLRFCEKHEFTATIINQTQGEEAGLKSVMIEIKGSFAYGWLKSERGVHRLVRLSPFNADHARQTSFALVEVLPEVKETEFKLDEKDLKIETYRASGHGGQSVNTTDSAVRITHLPSGISATCQNERSQLQNKQMALTVIKSKLALLEKEKNAKEMAKIKGENISAEWGNQIRSYVLHPYTLVKDHRTEFETSDSENVLNGNLDGFVEAYLRQNI